MTGRLAALFPSLAAGLGLPGFSAELTLEPSPTYVVVLIDGLGAQTELGRPPKAQTLTTTLPSTTATALTSLATGLDPGAHGILGFTMAYPNRSRILSPLHLSAAEGLEVQPRATIFERLRSLGVPVAYVGPGAFQRSGFSVATVRGTDYWPIQDEGSSAEFVTKVALAAADHRIVYAYYRGLDAAGHAHGLESAAWDQAQEWVVQTLRRLRAQLPDQVRILVTGDHGFINVAERIWLAEHPQLTAQVAAIGGEGRFVQLYTDEPESVAETWRTFLGTAGEVRLAAEATPWLGELAPWARPRLGDVLVGLIEPWLFVTPERPGEGELVGAHGGLTPAECLVPLLTW